MTQAPLGAANLGEIGVPAWGQGSGMSAGTAEPVFTWQTHHGGRDGSTCPDPVY